MIDTILKIENRKIGQLNPFKHNSRQHSTQQIAQIAASMTAFGWTIPVLIDEENTIIAGHGRVLAARSLLIESVPCIVKKNLTPEQLAALVIADNKLAENATWDNLTLAEQVGGLKLEGFDLGLIGFSDADLAQLFVSSDHVADAAGEFRSGMPEFEQPDKMAHRSIIVHFRDDESVAEFAKLLKQGVTPNTKYLWFPPQERNVIADKRYSSRNKNAKAKAVASKARAGKARRDVHARASDHGGTGADSSRAGAPRRARR